MTLSRRSLLAASLSALPRVVGRGAGASIALGASGVARAQAAASSPLAALGLPADWPALLARARGQTVYFNAWAGDEQTNAFIAWAGEQVLSRHGVRVVHTRLKDTAEAVNRVVAERSAGRERDGSVDLIWINGPNLLALKQQRLLLGPVLDALPNARFVDRVGKPSNLVDFTVPVEGFAVPWRLAQVVFLYDSARLPDRSALPRSALALLDWSRARPGRVTHPNASNFLGATFLKQALVDLLPDASPLQRPVSDDAVFATTTAPLWTWYEALRPTLWRRGQQFPENGSAQRQLLADAEIDISLSFNPSEAASGAINGLLPETVRTFTWTRGTIGNTSFVAIPSNARAREGALVLADFLLEPATQARAEDLRHLGARNVLDLTALSPAQRALFDAPGAHPALPTAAELGRPQLEPHPSWMTRVTAEWQRRTSR